MALTPVTLVESAAASIFRVQYIFLFANIRFDIHVGVDVQQQHAHGGSWQVAFCSSTGMLHMNQPRPLRSSQTLAISVRERCQCTL